MKKNELMNKVSRSVHKAGFSLKKHSPEILSAVGVVGVVVSAVMACKATTKLSDILKETEDELDKIQECADDPDMKEKYSEEDAKKDTVTVYVHTGMKLAKLYAPAVGLGVLSLGGLLVSNTILRKRSSSLAAAYVVLEKGFKEYRGRVIEQFGADMDRQLRYNIKKTEVEETIKDEKGKEKKVKKNIEVADPDVSGYLRYFTRSNPNWEDNSDFVDMFLQAQQNYANDKLRAVGHLTLNEVYDMLGMPDTRAGMVVGWIYDLDHPNGDNYVEFDIKKVYLPDERGEYEEAYAIDFNVDGNIYDKMV